MKNKIGIVGGGQLGRMLGIAAKRLGFHVTVIDPTPDSPAGQVVDKQIVAAVTDSQAIKQLASEVDFLTFEIELADSKCLSELAAQGITIHPSPATLTMIKDKYEQKKFLAAANIPVAVTALVSAKKDILVAAKKFGYPLVLKTRFGAYDGRGNALIKKPRDIESALSKLEGQQLYIEQWVPFIKELAVMAVRSTTGEVKVYPVVETIHKNHICHTVLAPAPVSTQIQKKAQRLAIKAMKQLQGAGVFGIEMFLTADEKIMINELAPRVHNSGHYTLEACVTDQFEQHIRAVTGMPLGSTQMLMPAAVMVNILGNRVGSVTIQGLEKALAIPHTAVHFYGKAETKLERKMGHLTVTDTTLEKAYKKARRAGKYLSI